jgi:hypothetical protein
MWRCMVQVGAGCRSCTCGVRPAGGPKASPTGGVAAGGGGHACWGCRQLERAAARQARQAVWLLSWGGGRSPGSAAAHGRRRRPPMGARHRGPGRPAAWSDLHVRAPARLKRWPCLHAAAGIPDAPWARDAGEGRPLGRAPMRCPEQLCQAAPGGQAAGGGRAPGRAPTRGPGQLRSDAPWGRAAVGGRTSGQGPASTRRQPPVVSSSIVEGAVPPHPHPPPHCRLNPPQALGELGPGLDGTTTSEGVALPCPSVVPARADPPACRTFTMRTCACQPPVWAPKWGQPTGPPPPQPTEGAVGYMK